MAKIKKPTPEEQQAARKRIIIAHLKGIIRDANYCLIRLVDEKGNLID